MIAGLVVAALLFLGSCGARTEDRFTESTGVLSGRGSLTAPVLTSPASDPLSCPAENAGVVYGESGDEIERPVPWIWPRSADGMTRCNETLDEKRVLAWPFAPLPRAGGLEITGTWRPTAQGIMVEGIRIRNARPTDARLRVLRVIAHDTSEEVARGMTEVVGVTDVQRSDGVVVPGASPDGTIRSVSIPEPLLLPYTSERPIDAGAVALTFEVESYDVVYRIASAGEAERYADVDDIRAVPVGMELATHKNPVELGTTPGGEVCLTNRSFDTYQEAVIALSLPRPTPRRPERFVDDEPVFIATIEILHWPEWDDIHKSGAVVPEQPLDPIPDDWPTLSEDEKEALANAWELCATELAGRVVAVSRLPSHAPVG